MSRIVVVGGSLSGLRTVEALYGAGWAGEVVVISEETHLPYTRPPLSKAALKGAPDLGSLLFKQRPEADRAEWIRGVRAVATDLAARRVALSDGRIIEYDGLVAATGVRARRLPIPHGSAGFVVRTFDDCCALQRRLIAGARVVVVGAGFIGCEVAATATQLGCRVDVVAPDRTPLQVPLGTMVGGAVQRRHERHGIRFHLGAGVRRVTESGTTTSVELTDDSVLTGDVLVQAVGSAPAVDWLAGNGLDLSDGIACDNDLRMGGGTGSVAVGDVARFPNPLFDDVPRRVEHWQIPAVTATRAAATLMHDLAGAPPSGSAFTPLPSFWSDQADLRLQSFGSLAVADRAEVLEGDLESEAVVGYFRGAALTGVLLLGLPKKAVAARRMVLESLGTSV
ncbi:NAD(P)/FAD-dependent oxidoreductase [Nocardia flavorosea]|uniref:NAD(P)/FAD-dependent oxidoreductase n=1 Tax=Nocardia flavorosea TaxID=53429 RepID=UPI002458E502|nr:FAD-dependent oxidoreductase [Nocardia flavorosea]